jgi:hypothetical protein
MEAAVNIFPKLAMLYCDDAFRHLAGEAFFRFVTSQGHKY